MEQTSTPAAAAKFARDAEAAGFEVTITRSGSSVELYVKREETNANLAWDVKNVAGLNGQGLGFSTSYKAGVRFSDGQVHIPGLGHQAVRTVAAARLYLGL